MSLTNPVYKVNTTFSAKNISSAASIYQYTADGDYKLIIEAYLDGVAGGGDYVAYLTKQLVGAGTAYPILPKTTSTAAAGETAFGLATMEVQVKTGDVINLMVDGLAGDTSISGKVRIVADNWSVFEAADEVTLTTASVTEVQTGLSTFDPAVDEVTLADASVTEVQSGLSTFDPATDEVTLAAASVTEVTDAVMDEPIGSHTGWLTKLLSITKFLGLK